ncbi:hypothetical protein [Pelagibius marinus]|uniref:hypothetical protein n=1 Tax=Pelagibius marinus TaxID=2762760 RepID=UPI001872CB1F|nr:hypothetical protein [Pelagibius marinus]
MSLPTNQPPLRSILSPILGLSLLLIVSACARTQPVLNITEEAVVTASGEAPSLAEVENAIVTACHDKSWLVDPTDEGHIVATAHVRHHTAIVDIVYSTERYSITYKDSDVLLYDGEKIHRNYNKWVQLLSERINLELNKL